MARLGSFTKAAAHLGKGHTGVIYLLKTLEDRLGLKLLDRSRYRTSLTPTGRLIWAECQKILSAERQLLNVCSDITQGWEPYLTAIFDGILPVEDGLKIVECLEKRSVPTRISIYTEFFSAVEERFVRENADLMISVLPPQHAVLESVSLPPLRVFLVAHSGHPLAKSGRKFTEQELREQVKLTVRGSDSRLGLSTASLDTSSQVHVSDFYAKKAAILQGLGYGWLPEHLIEKELKNKKLKVIRWEKSNTHVYHPKLYHRGEKLLGRAARTFLSEVLAHVEEKKDPTRW